MLQLLQHGLVTSPFNNPAVTIKCNAVPGEEVLGVQEGPERVLAAAVGVQRVLPELEEGLGVLVGFLQLSGHQSLGGLRAASEARGVREVLARTPSFGLGVLGARGVQGGSCAVEQLLARLGLVFDSAASLLPPFLSHSAVLPVHHEAYMPELTGILCINNWKQTASVHARLLDELTNM